MSEVIFLPEIRHHYVTIACDFTGDFKSKFPVSKAAVVLQKMYDKTSSSTEKDKVNSILKTIHYASETEGKLTRIKKDGSCILLLTFRFTDKKKLSEFENNLFVKLLS